MAAGAMSPITISTSGRSVNLLRAVTAARERGLATWALTGPPNPLAAACDEAVCVRVHEPLVLTATVQEAHEVALHLSCLAFDATSTRSTRLNGHRPTALHNGHGHVGQETQWWTT